MGTSLQPLVATLESAANAAPDIYELAFNRYFELCPASRELLQHSDELMRGRMMEQVMGLLMDESAADLEVYFKFEVANHEGYGAAPVMYQHLFAACKEVTQANSGDAWNASANESWDQQIGLLLGLIEKYSS